MRKILMIALAIVGALGMTIGTAVSASATIYDETYSCQTDSRSIPGEYDIGSCDGVWWHDNTTRRTLRIHFVNVTHAVNSGYNNTPIDYISKLDGDAATIQFFCVNERYNIHSYVGQLLLGGTRAYNHSWPGGWNPCTGNWTGMEVYASGYYAGSQSCTRVYVNTSDNIFSQRGRQSTYPSGGC